MKNIKQRLKDIMRNIKHRRKFLWVIICRSTWYATIKNHKPCITKEGGEPFYLKQIGFHRWTYTGLTPKNNSSYASTSILEPHISITQRYPVVSLTLLHLPTPKFPLNLKNTHDLTMKQQMN